LSHPLAKCSISKPEHFRDQQVPRFKSLERNMGRNTLLMHSEQPREQKVMNVHEIQLGRMSFFLFVLF